MSFLAKLRAVHQRAVERRRKHGRQVRESADRATDAAVKHAILRRR